MPSTHAADSISPPPLPRGSLPSPSLWPYPPQRHGSQRRNRQHRPRRRLGYGNDRGTRGAIARRGKRCALDADVEVDDAVIIHVDLPVVIEVSVVPARRAERDVQVDATVVVDVDLSVEIRVPAI